MQPALDGINALQSVPWRVNQRVLSAIQKLADSGIEIKGLPAADTDIPQQPKPWDDMTPEERSLWKKQVEQIKIVNRGRIGDRLKFREDTATAERLGYQRFWTPMKMDSRGRIYGVPSFNFQREDRVRALFEFADGEPIGEDGLYWLKVHVANCGNFGKISKRPFEERVAWVSANLDRIHTTTTSYMECLWWTEADKPFLFLASCFELVAAISHGPSYVTHLPISFDGSCSGLQHLCAMTRAAEGALVNLTPAASPQDVYEIVANRVSARIASLETTDDATLAARCLEYGIGRQEVKRNVMTYSYSSKKFGMAEQQREDLMKPLALEVLTGERKEHPFGDDEGYRASKYLAGHIYEAIEEVVQLPALAMGFLQRLAKALAHEGKPLRWTTPVGLPWINRYHEPDTKVVTLWLHDRGVKLKKYQVTLAVGDKSEIDKTKAANGVAPNFVHALDAAHLLRTATAAKAEGIAMLATVHDSFGCLASRASRFRQIILEEFVRMYEEHDVLAEVLETAKHDLTQANWHRLPYGVPPRGPLDLREVLNAKFAFS